MFWAFSPFPVSISFLKLCQKFVFAPYKNHNLLHCFFYHFWFRRDIKTMWNTKAKRISKGFFYSTINLFIWNKFGKLNVRHNLYVKQVFPWKLRNASPPCPLWNFQKPVNSFSTKLIYFFRDLVWKILVQKHFQY